MAKWVRLWGKKRGTRMSGWWVVGSVSEAAFFGALFLLGIVSLTIVVSGQVFWPHSPILRIGFGFWLMVIASSSFMVIGLTAFILQVSQTLASPEMRSAMVDKAKREHQRRAKGLGTEELPHLPRVRVLTDSPGVKLAYRLAIQRGETTPLLLSTLFTLAWNAMLAVLLVIAVQNHLSGQPDWFLTVLLLPFAVVSFFSTRWFFRLFRRQSGIGPTAVEISDLPLLPKGTYQLYVCQYGRAAFKRYEVWLVSFEETTYQQGTDVRTERVEIQRLRLVPTAAEECTERVACPEKPLEMDCQFQLPADIMHSFQGRHNAIVWKIVIEGEAQKWPSFCRNFPVVVFPPDAT
ncbi:MAG: ABC transporter ATP-binding protein [Planctomycetales bacterium]|nr:ABC transporter ATP-binding protein [Planctomycetales bacterium]